MAKPFRWQVARREQLGSLAEPAPDFVPPDEDFLSELRATAARILALADDADFAFIGRSPENVFDYLSGAFETLDEPLLHLVQFSLRWPGRGGAAAMPAHQLGGLFDYFEAEGVSARQIASARRPLALVDVVSRGGTMYSFASLLKLQAERTRTDWRAVQRRLRIIGLRERTKNSPKTWRWQQHAKWLADLPDAKVLNVSASPGFLFTLAGYQAKTTPSHTPERWADGDLGGAGETTRDQADALAFAARLYDIGKSRTERLALAGEIAQQTQMRQPATRRLVSRLKGTA